MLTSVLKWKYLLICLLIVLLGCESEVYAPVEPSKPGNVPSEAVWVGGIDGGVFVLVTRPRGYQQDMYFGEIYYVSGDLAYKGKLRMFPNGAKAFDPGDQSSFEGWDGDMLFLIENRYLKVQE